MDTRKEDDPTEDEFTPIELGTVSEETRGGQLEGDEYGNGPVSRA